MPARIIQANEAPFQTVPVDPVTLDIIENALRNARIEMDATLARTAMYAKGVEIWTAPTWDNGENWVATLRHIAREGRVFVIGVTTLLRGSDVPDDVPGRELWGGEEDWCNDGWSAIVDPDGQLLAGPLVGEEASSPRRSIPRGCARSATSSIRSAITRGPTSSRSR